MSANLDNLWNLTAAGPQIDPNDLQAALDAPYHRQNLDFRSRLLIRDCLDALARFRSRDTLMSWLGNSPHGNDLMEIWESDLGPVGFPSLEHRLMEKTDPERVIEFFREVGLHVRQQTRIDVGGAVALILAGSLSRHTEDIDVVNEVPVEIRAQYDLLERLAKRYGLHLTHFQSHYLPTRWEQRVRSLDRFGQLDVFLVDAYDIFVGKLSSKRDKDLDDLRMLKRILDKASITARLQEDGALMMAEPQLAESAKRNWYIVYGEALPV